MTPRWRLDDERRLAAMVEAELFPGVLEATLDPYAQIVAELLHVPVALVSIVADDRQFFPAHVGLGEPWATRGQTPLEMSFCQHVVVGDAPLVIVDSTGDDRVAGNLAIEELDVMAYLGVPLRAPGGEPLGALCAIDHEPRSWSDRELGVLQHVADAVAQSIALRTSEHRWARYASEASHKLRTPVTAVRLELDDLSAWPTIPADAREVIQAAADQAGQLSAAVDDLAAVVRARRRLDESSVAVEDVVRSAVELSEVPGTADGSARVTTIPTMLRSVVRDVVLLLAEAGAPDVRAEVDPSPGACRVAIRSTRPLDGVLPIGSLLRERVVNQLGARLSPLSTGDGYELVLPAFD